MANTYSLDLESGSSQSAGRTTDAMGITGGAISLEAWIKVESLPTSTNRMHVVHHGDAGTDVEEWIQLFNDSGTQKILFTRLRQNTVQDDASYTVTLSLGVWYHVALTYDATNVRGYLNGELVAGPTASSGNGASAGVTGFWVGYNGPSSDRYFDGLVDEVRIWSDERTQAEIATNMYQDIDAASAGLVGYYKFENDYTDETSNGYDLTASGSPVFVTGASNVPSTKYKTASSNILSLDLESGSSQNASIADGSQTGLDLSGDWTIEGWVNFESLPANNFNVEFINKHDASTYYPYETYFRNDGGTYKLGAMVNGNSSGTAYDNVLQAWTPTVGVWYHIAITCDISAATATTFEFFVNGVSLGNGTASSSGNASSIYNSTGTFYLGSRSASGYVDGKLDDWRVWSDIRTDAEILANYGKELVGDEAGLVAYWKLNGDYLDETSNNNDLTASGSPVFSGITPFFDNVAIFYSATGTNAPIDGYAMRASVDQTFANIRAGAGTASNDGDGTLGFGELKGSTTSNQYQKSVLIFQLFDLTTQLAGTETIDDASLNILGSGATASALGHVDMIVAQGSPAASNTIATGDYANYSTTTFATVNSANWNTATFNSLAFNAAGVTYLGTVIATTAKFSFMNDWFRSGTFGGTWASAAATYVLGEMSDRGGGYKPFLAIEYSTPSATAIKDIIGSGMIPFPR